MIGLRLREERERLGLSQEAFAALAEASKRSQIEWEKGTAFPNAEALAAFAAQGADVQYIITGIKSPAAQQIAGAVEAAFTMVQRGAVAVTAQQFAQMAMTLMPAFSTPQPDKKTKDKSPGKKTTKVGGNAQIAEGTGIVQVGGNARKTTNRK